MKKISIKDPLYPEELENIHQAPPELYYIGDISLLKAKSIGVVGPRKASFYGQKVTKQFIPPLVRAGYCIVSGLAMGIDSLAHRETLEHGGKTIAVLGCGIDIIYPAHNRRLYEEIAQTGLIISEFPPGTPAYRGNFPQRNRIISGLSQGVLVIEAGKKSGSLITAKYALSQDREVFAVPNSIYHPNSAGVHEIISNDKARLVTSPAEIIDELGLPLQKTIFLDQVREPYSYLNKEEQALVKLLRDRPLTSIELATKSKTPLQKAAILLTELELKEVVRKAPGARYELA